MHTDSRYTLNIFFYFITGFLFAIVIQGAFVIKYNGDLTSLINLGEQSREKEALLKDVGSMYIHKGIGHDGIPTFISARDPFLTKGLGLSLDDSNGAITYRYRRILFPLLGGMFGLLSPHSTIISLALLSSIACGITTAILGWIAIEFNRSPLITLAALGNIGFYCSLNTLTSDILAACLGLLALSAWWKKKHSLLFFSLAGAALSKEIYILVAFSLASISLYERSPRYAAKILFAGLSPLLLWSLYLWYAVPSDLAFASRGNLTMPGLGIFIAASYWPELVSIPSELLFILLSITIIILHIFRIIQTRSIHITLLCAPWIILFLCSGSIVWDLGNNIARATSFMWILLAFTTLPLQQRR